MRCFRFTAVLLTAIVLLSSPGESFAARTKRIKIKSVMFEGNNAFSDRRLTRVIISKPSRLFSRSYYRSEIFEDDIKALELFYRQNGYLEATVPSHSVQIDSTRYTASIEIGIEEGKLTLVEGIAVLGNIVYGDEVLRSKIILKSGDPFQRKKIDNSTVALLTHYANNGYLNAEIKPDIKINTETKTALVDFYVTENKQFKIDNVSLTGLDKTRSRVVTRELLFHRGEVINYSRLLESQRNIYMTGLFQSVFVRPVIPAAGDSSKKDVLVEVKENMTGEFNVAVGYGSVERARTKVEVFNNNLRGTALKLGVTGKISFVDYGLMTSFTNPWTFGLPLRTDVNLFTEFKDEPGYDLKRHGGRIVVGRKFRRNINATVTYRQERTILSNIRVSTIPKDVKTNIRSLKLDLIRDTRDNLFNPSRGTYYEISNEMGGFVTDKIDAFFRVIGRAKFFTQIGSKTVLASAVELGWMDAQGGIMKIPLQERFYAGGPASLRAFEYEKVGPLDRRRVPIGGKLKFVWNPVELRQTIYNMVGGALFVDVGNVWSKPEDVEFKDLRVSLGTGLRINTPIGLARLDYGFNPTPKKDESRGHIYFSMGHAF